MQTEKEGEKGDATHKGNYFFERKVRLDNLHLKNLVNFVADYEMPSLKPCLVIPSALVPFNMAFTEKNYDRCVHFFIDDYQFERIWNQPFRYVRLLTCFKCVIAPDFSQYIDMPYPQRLWNNYRGKLIGAWLQSQGIAVILNVTWSLPDSYDYCFAGIPKRSVVAINSTGAARYGLARFLWLKGYREAISRLNPIAIIRYGNIISGEDESLGIYFQNERLIKLRTNGR